MDRRMNICCYKSNGQRDHKMLLTVVVLFFFMGIGSLTSLIMKWTTSTQQQISNQNHWRELPICNRTYTYLPAIDHYYKDSASQIIILSPTNYEILPDGHLWEFDKNNESWVEVAVFIPAFLKNITFFLHSHDDQNSTETLSFSIVKENGSWVEYFHDKRKYELENPEILDVPFNEKKEPLNNFVESLHEEPEIPKNSVEYLHNETKNCLKKTKKYNVSLYSNVKEDILILDLSSYGKHLKNKNWNLSIKTENRQNRSNNMTNNLTNTNKEATLVQPVLCVQYRKSKNNEKDLQAVIKKYLAERINKETTTKRNQTESSRSGRRVTRSLHEKRECHIKKMDVKLEDLISDVIHPRMIELNYCSGTCHMLDDPNLFNNNARLRVRYKFLYGRRIPAPQCTPTQFSSVDIFVTSGNHIRKERLHGLDVTACGCR